jgi:hypothetical protein
MDLSLRRDFLKQCGLAVLVSLTGIPASSSKAYIPSPETRKQMAEVAMQSGYLARWMSTNHHQIFASAPNEEDYAVGIYKGSNQIPEIHYFDNLTKARQFRVKNKIDVTNIRSNKPEDY